MYAFTIFCVEIEVFFFFFFSTIEIQKVNIKAEEFLKLCHIQMQHKKETF